MSIWTAQQYREFQKTGKKPEEIIVPKKKVKQSEKISYPKLFIEAHLKAFCEANGYELRYGDNELKFAEKRRFKFDYAILEIKLAVEYEGIYSRKSRHTTQTGYNRDTIKYNLATSLGWKVYRYTAQTYKNIIDDIKLKQTT